MITPGPWDANYGCKVLDHDGTIIADCNMLNKYDESLSNARAIASVPELIEALQGALFELEEVTDDGQRDIPGLIATVKAALQKAGVMG